MNSYFAENSSAVMKLMAAYGGRIRSTSELTKAQRAEVAKIGNRRGLGWKPLDGATIEFADVEPLVLDFDPVTNKGTIVMPAFDGVAPVMVRIQALTRMCEDTREVLAEKCPTGITNTLLHWGQGDEWRATVLRGRSFTVRVFEVDKVDRYFDDSGKLVDRLDVEGKPVTYRATMIWLDQEVTASGSSAGTGRRRRSNAS